MINENEHPVHRVRELDPETLPLGRLHRVNVELVGDGLGRDILVPVLVARGRRPGPVFGLTAAVHGNELNGIRVIHDLFEHLDLQSLKGTVVGVVAVNVEGVIQHQREFTDGRDLNHSFPGRDDGSTIEVYAHRLVHRIVKRFDYLVDLHTASFGRINSLYIRADMTHPVTAAMAYRMRPEIIVHNPASDRTLRGAAMEMEIPAITVEIGDPQLFQPKLIKSTRLGLRALLADARMLPRRPLAEGLPPVLCERSYWLYTDRGGLLEVQPGTGDMLAKGGRIATLRNAFGDVRREYMAPEDGVVVGKSVNPVGQTGARILHLGVLAKEPERFLQRLSNAKT